MTINGKTIASKKDIEIAQLDMRKGNCLRPLEFITRLQETF